MLSGDTRVQRATKWRGFWRALAVATKEATDKDRQNEALKQGMFQKLNALRADSRCDGYPPLCGASLFLQPRFDLFWVVFYELAGVFSGSASFS